MKLYPRLPNAVAEVEYMRLQEGAVPANATAHPGQIFAPVGGSRATEVDIETMQHQVRAAAVAHGFPESTKDADRIAFDRRAASIVADSLRVGWPEAASAAMWSFIALVALPEETHWRFGLTNRERWVASDLTRHTWAKLWWQATVFAGNADLLDRLTESDLNQLLERRSIGGDPSLVVELATAVLEASDVSEIGRRRIIRDATARLRRRLAFIDVRGLSEVDLKDLCESAVAESLRYLTHLPEVTDVVG